MRVSFVSFLYLSGCYDVTPCSWQRRGSAQVSHGGVGWLRSARRTRRFVSQDTGWRRCASNPRRATSQSFAHAIVAERFAVSRAMVCYHIALLPRLPSDFVAWLEQEDDRTIWAHFTEHRLRPVARIAEQEEQVRRLAVMIDEVRALSVRRSSSDGRQAAGRIVQRKPY